MIDIRLCLLDFAFGVERDLGFVFGVRVSTQQLIRGVQVLAELFQEARLFGQRLLLLLRESCKKQKASWQKAHSHRRESYFKATRRVFVWRAEIFGLGIEH